MTDKKSQPTGRQQLQTKWALLVVAMLLAYGTLQPLASARLGWKLPSLVSLIGQGDSKLAPESQGSVAATSTASMDEERTESPSHPSTSVSASETVGTFGYLQKIGEADYLSPAGLRYGRGSQEGHRLKHLARHLEDQPDRPGSHGVFLGDMNQVLIWLDDAYQRAKGGARGTSQRNELERTVYEAEFAEPIGFVGGQQGRRNGNPEASSIRLVTEGKRVITAFPF